MFTHYRTSYEAGDGGQAIFMQENFRSRRMVIDFANLISRYMFAAGDTPFNEKDELVCTRSGDSAPVEICLIPVPEDDEEAAPANGEAEYVAGRIHALLQGDAGYCSDRT